MTWEDPDKLPKKKLSREEYLQRMLTSLVLGSPYPRWNTHNIPSVSGDSFLRKLHKQVYGNELVGALEFVDELELLSGNDKDPNGAPDYAVFSQSGIWSLSSKRKLVATEKTSFHYMCVSREMFTIIERFQSLI
jgi:hypothetical protein